MTCFLILNSSQLPKQKENLRFRPAHGRNGGFLLVRGSGRKQTATSCRKVRLAHPGWPGIPLSGICRMAAALKYGEYSARFISKQSRKAPTATRHLPPCSGFAMPRSSGRIFAFLCHSRFSRRTFVFSVARALPVPAARTLPWDGALGNPAALPGKSAFFPLKCPIRR